MTKCHTLSLLVLLLAVFSCKPAGQGGSLSEYGSHSEATQFALFEQYVQKLLAAEPQRALQMQDSVIAEALSDSTKWAQLTKLEDKFIMDPNSPYRSEELYIPVAEAILKSDLSSEELIARAGWVLPKLKLNRPGEPAADFEFITPKGRRSSLYQTIDSHNPKQTILFFSNPGCPNCKEITEALSRDLRVEALIAKGDLLVVNIYPDEDVQAWLDYLPNYPASWVCGQDEDQILNSYTIYWLRAIPSLYLLDKEKRVILKDAPLERLLPAISNQ